MKTLMDFVGKVRRELEDMVQLPVAADEDELKALDEIIKLCRLRKRVVKKDMES